MTGKGEPEERPVSATIDWSEVRRRLEMVQAITERGFEPTLEARKQILKNRVRTLAGERKEGEAVESLEVVEFLLASEKYGIESRRIREVYPMKELTPLPCTPPFVRGIINLRGQILSVIDIKKFFDLPEKGLTDLNKVIVVRMDEMELGILVDVILGMRVIPLQEIQPPLPTWTDIRSEYLRGVTNQRIAVLDIDRILSDKRIVVHEEVET